MNVYNVKYLELGVVMSINSIHWIVFCIILPRGFDKCDEFDDRAVVTTTSC